jgi:hypothetical protein
MSSLGVVPSLEQRTFSLNQGTRQIDVKTSASEEAKGRFGRFFKDFLLNSMYSTKARPAYVLTPGPRVARFAGNHRKTPLNLNVFAGADHSTPLFLAYKIPRICLEP